MMPVYIKYRGPTSSRVLDVCLHTRCFSLAFKYVHIVPIKKKGKKNIIRGGGMKEKEEKQENGKENSKEKEHQQYKDCIIQWRKHLVCFLSDVTNFSLPLSGFPDILNNRIPNF